MTPKYYITDPGALPINRGEGGGRVLRLKILAWIFQLEGSV